MKLTPFVLPLVFVACSIIPPKESEEDPYMFFASVGGMYAISQFDFDRIEGQLGNYPKVEFTASDSYGFDIRIGHRINDIVALDIQYSEYFDGSIDLSFPQYNIENLEVATYCTTTLFANMRSYFTKPKEVIQPYVSVGVGMVDVHIDSENIPPIFKEDITDFGFKLGGGVDVQLVERLFLYLDAAYVIPVNELINFKIIPLSAGIQFRF